MKRAHFISFSCLHFIAALAAMLYLPNVGSLLVTFLALSWTLTAVARCQDAGIHSLWAIAAWLPLIGWFVIPYLMCRSSAPIAEQ